MSTEAVDVRNRDFFQTTLILFCLAAEEGELSFDPGDIITDVEQLGKIKVERTFF